MEDFQHNADAEAAEIAAALTSDRPSYQQVYLKMRNYQLSEGWKMGLPSLKEGLEARRQADEAYERWFETGGLAEVDRWVKLSLLSERVDNFRRYEASDPHHLDLPMEAYYDKELRPASKQFPMPTASGEPQLEALLANGEQEQQLPTAHWLSSPSVGDEPPADAGVRGKHRWARRVFGLPITDEQAAEGGGRSYTAAIKQRYRALSTIHHPDKKKEAALIQQRLNAAYAAILALSKVDTREEEETGA